MTSSPAQVPAHSAKRSNKSIYLVLGCTVFAATAQVLLKFGADHPMPVMNPADTSTWMPFLMALLGNYYLLLGYCFHAGNALLLILALRDGELSVLFPIISLSYVWVDLLSMYFFHEHMNVWKAAGILLVIGGVALLGRASSRP